MDFKKRGLNLCIPERGPLSPTVEYVEFTESGGAGTDYENCKKGLILLCFPPSSLSPMIQFGKVNPLRLKSMEGSGMSSGSEVRARSAPQPTSGGTPPLDLLSLPSRFAMNSKENIQIV